MARCAIYTRKSTDEGLDQEFNSLDAQREACEAYIKSQKHEGWKALPQHYDDGGYSGGSMDRPALKQLLKEIEAKRVDIVMVYKVDRLTRSLPDFVRMVEQFDRNGVSFVSVTQQFNTTSSMGRLTLNMLLSFAQFEREVTAERIRDKVAASKKKGMWMGGPPPLGYDVQDRKLVVNKTEAKMVRALFDLYLELGTVRRLKEEADWRGIVTKRRLIGGMPSGGKPFSRGNLYVLLSNPLYVGDVGHKGAIYPGLHDAIVSRDKWAAVQKGLVGNSNERSTSNNLAGPHLLTGLIFAETGERLCPTHANKKGRRYHYYISQQLMHKKRADEDGWRLPAKPLDEIVIRSITDLLNDQNRLTDSLELSNTSARELEVIKRRSAILGAELAGNESEIRAARVRALIKSVVVASTSVSITLRRSGLPDEDGVPSESTPEEATINIKVPIQIRRRGVETKLVVASENSKHHFPDHNLIRLIARAQRWLDELTTGEVVSIQELGKREKMDERNASRILRLAFIAPQIVEDILEGKHPADLTMRKLQRTCFTNYKWLTHLARLGFSKN